MAHQGSGWPARWSFIFRAANWMAAATLWLIAVALAAIVRLVANMRARSIVDARARMLDRSGVRPGNRTRR